MLRRVAAASAAALVPGPASGSAACMLAVASGRILPRAGFASGRGERANVQVEPEPEVDEAKAAAAESAAAAVDEDTHYDLAPEEKVLYDMAQQDLALFAPDAELAAAEAVTPKPWQPAEDAVIELESRQYLGSGSVSGDVGESDGTDQHVVLRVRVSDLGLSEPASALLRQVVGPRYRAGTDTLKLVASTYATTSENEAEALRLLRELVSECNAATESSSATAS